MVVPGAAWPQPKVGDRSQESGGRGQSVECCRPEGDASKLSCNTRLLKQSRLIIFCHRKHGHSRKNHEWKSRRKIRRNFSLLLNPSVFFRVCARIDRKNRWSPHEIFFARGRCTSRAKNHRTAPRRNPAARCRESSAAAWSCRTRTAP